MAMLPKAIVDPQAPPPEIQTFYSIKTNDMKEQLMEGFKQIQNVYDEEMKGMDVFNSQDAFKLEFPPLLEK